MNLMVYPGVIAVLVMILALWMIVPMEYTAASTARLTGEQFLENGTDPAYLDNRTMQQSHNVTAPRDGSFYDNSTVFFTGDILGNSNSTLSNNTTSSGNATNVSIIFGSSELGIEAYDPNPAKVKVGDTVTWINDDQYAHIIKSPPSGSGTIGMNFTSHLIKPGDTFSYAFTRPGEFYYNDPLFPRMIGKVTVEEKAAAGSNNQ